MAAIQIQLLLLIFIPMVQDSSVDDGAKKALEAMSKAYREIRSLEQETVYEGMGNLVKSRLMLQRPNRVLMEVSEKRPPAPEPLVTKALCDGKDLYIYRQINGWYTKGKAPKDFKGFTGMASSLELAAVACMDPFAELVKQAKEVRLDTPEIADGVQVEVVRLMMASPEQTGTVRVFIGKDDHLLRRFTMESTAILPPAEKSEGTAAHDSAAKPAPKVTMRYDNRVVANKGLPKELFVWSPPNGALPFQWSQVPPTSDPGNPTGQNGKQTGKQKKVIWVNKVHPKSGGG